MRHLYGAPRRHSAPEPPSRATLNRHATPSCLLNDRRPLRNVDTTKSEVSDRYISKKPETSALPLRSPGGSTFSRNLRIDFELALDTIAAQGSTHILVLHPCLVGDRGGGLGDLLNVVALEDDLVLDLGEGDLGALEHGAVTDDLLADWIPSVSEGFRR
jgi:hypothetical protein